MLAERTVAVALSVLVVAFGLTAACDGAPASTGQAERLKIAFLMPDVHATRYDRFDVPYFVRKVEDLCGRCDVIHRNAAELPRTQRFQAIEAMDNGADVLVLDPVDAAGGREITQIARRRNIPVIAYDRLIQRADVDYYVSFDNENIGRLQAAALVQRLHRAGVQSGKVVMINGSHTDNNALMFNKGARSVLDRTPFETVPDTDYFTPGWSPAAAKEFMSAQVRSLRIARAGSDVVAVYAANDGLAGGAIEALKAAGIVGMPVTGQDAELAAIQRILLGEQYMTVQKDYRQEAERTAEFAVALARGERLKASSTINNGNKDVPTELVGVVTITRENIQSAVLDAGLYTMDELCVDRFRKACAEAGLH